MEVNILHLYNNLMNLYGEYANITVLKKHIEDQNVQVNVTTADSVSDVDLQDFDLLYIGSGTEKNQKLALADFITKKDEIISLAKSGKVMLFTGNSFEMLGSSITSADGKEYKGLALADFTTTEQNKKRLTSDVIANCSLCNEKIVGFINKASEIKGVDNCPNEIIMGFGNDNSSKTEGFAYKNVFGTHIIGPVLVKNPPLMKYIVNLVCTSKDSSFKYSDIKYIYEENAYKVTYQKLSERLGEN